MVELFVPLFVTRKPRGGRFVAQKIHGAEMRGGPKKRPCNYRYHTIQHPIQKRGTLMGSNSNVQHLSDKTLRHTVRIMDKSPHSGIVLDKRADDFLIINVNEVVNGLRSGCATLVFEGDLPTAAEIRDMNLMIEGVWGHHATFGARFDVHAWGPVDRPVIEQPAPKKKTRRLSTVPDKPKKPRTRRLSAVPPSPAPLKAAAQSTNDWYAQSGGQGDSLDLLDQ